MIGTGLIGGSIGLAIREAHPSAQIVGFDGPETLDRAVERGAVTEAASEIADAVANADIIFVATPLSSIPFVFEEIGPLLQEDAIVTDVGSVKTVVCDWAAEILPSRVHFIGGHPMAGSEHRGIEYADKYLLENASYVLCPSDSVPGDRLEDLIELLESIGARILILDSKRHDRIAAAVSHTPQLLAVALANVAATRNRTDEATLRLAAGGFRDMTRIASSPFHIWRDILSGNHDAILDSLAELSSELQRIRNRLIEEDLGDIEDLFDGARTARESIPRNTKGFLRPLSDVYVDAADRPGALLAIVKQLFESGLNIKDIELLKLREGTGGTFRLGFETGIESRQAIEVLIADGHQARQL